jgi:hypothetical protein
MVFWGAHSGLLHGRVRLDESGPSFQRALVPLPTGLTTTTAMPEFSRETPTDQTPETHVQERLKRLLVRIGDTLKRLRSISVGRWWLAWVSGAR